MNTSLFSSDLGGIDAWHIAGWTMLHFLWLGALLTLGAALCRLITRRAAPNIRYAIALMCLLVMAALPPVVAVWVLQNVPTPFTPAHALSVNESTAASPASNRTDSPIVELSGRDQAPPDLQQAQPLIGEPAGDHVASAGGDQTAIGGTTIAALESCVHYLPWLWLIGAPITFTLLATGLVGTRRLQRSSRPVDDEPITHILRRLIESLQIARSVTVAVCERVAAPVLVGILRPIILLPPAALTGWSPDEIEMVLLHELAHVRRWDNLVNLIQRLVESLLFFHPAIWLVSNWVRRERETCCDALVVRRTNRPHAYAEMLVALAAQMPRSVLFHPAASSAMAAGPLHARIRRILQLEDDPMLISGKSFAIMFAGLVVAATIVLLYLPTIGQAEESATEATESTELTEKESEKPSADVSFPADGTSSFSEPASVVLMERQEKSPFPSLEEQKRADLAWKRLQLELEPIGTEDLKRVQALGYKGGVIVAAIGSTSTIQEQWKTADILVGLHVWPTISMDHVFELLHREDLAELNPLKFYVVRTEMTGGTPDHPILGDVVRTGRVSVTLGGGGFGGFGGRTTRSQSAASSLTTPAAVTKPPTAATSTPSTSPKLAAEKSALRYDGNTFDEWQQAWRTELSTEKRLEAVKALAAFGAAGYGQEAADAIIEIAGQYPWSSLGDNKAIQPLRESCLDAFGGNRGILPNELPANDASAALLRASESNNKSIRQFVATALRKDARTEPAAMEAVIKLSRDKDPDVNRVAWNSLVDVYSPASAAALERVREALASDQPELQIGALKAVWNHDLTKTAPQASVSGVTNLPEIYSLLFSDEHEVRRHARRTLQRLAKDDASRAVEQLLEMLQDESRRADHIEAIRALAVLGLHAKPAVDVLHEIFVTDNNNLRIPAAVALKSILGDLEFNKLLGKTIADELKIHVSDTGLLYVPAPPESQAYTEFDDAIKGERKNLLP